MAHAIGGYRVSERIARGASTETMIVHNTADDARFVAKRLVPRLRADPTATAHLDLEGRVLRALEGRGAPRWVASGADREGAWLVMEYVAIATLGARIREGGDASFAERASGDTLRVMADVHEATDGAGALAVVHGDVSAGNVLAGDGERPACFVDFGLASFRDGAVALSGGLRGTVLYVAPEVARGEPATVRSDLFSLGLTLLHVASGEPPRPGDHGAALILSAGEGTVLPYAERASRRLGARVRDALLAMVAFDPKDRPPGARHTGAGSW